MDFYFAGPAEGGTCMDFYFAGGPGWDLFFAGQVKGYHLPYFYKGSWRQIDRKRKILTRRPQGPQIRLSGRPRGRVWILFSRAGRPGSCMDSIFAGPAGGGSCMDFIFAGGIVYGLYFRGAGRRGSCMDSYFGLK